MLEESSCNNFATTTIVFSSYKVYSFDSWQNNDLHNTSRYFKFKNCLKFYVPTLDKTHTHKNNHTFLQNNSQHMAPNLGP
jgi:hypothetical protein